MPKQIQLGTLFVYFILRNYLMRLSSLILTFALTMSILALSGQDSIAINNPYKQAQALVVNQEIKQAIEIIEQYSLTTQLNRDYLLYLARLYFWNRQMEPALENLDILFHTWPNDYQAHKLLIDIYESQNLYSSSHEKIQNALKIYPEDNKLRYRLAYNLYLQEKYEEARALTKSLVHSDPENKALKQLDSELASKLLNNFIQVEYRNFFLTQRDQRLDFQIYKYGRHFAKSTVIGQLISGRSLDKRGLQTGLVLYKEIDKKTYSFFQVAYSTSDLFPDLRANAAVYLSMKKNFESSLFISYLKVNSDITTVLSPSVTKNIRRAALKATANIVNRDSKIELTYRLGYRQYLPRGSNYVGLAYGSLSRNEMIRGEELFLTANYISYETRWALGKRINIGLIYNRTITDRAKNRDQLNLYAKHDF